MTELSLQDTSSQSDASSRGLIPQTQAAGPTTSTPLIQKLVDSFALSLGFMLLFSFAIGWYPLQVPDEARYVEIAREMFMSGDLVTPTMNGWWYFEKPVLFYWLQAAVIAVAGLGEAAMRSTPICFAVIGTVTTYWLGVSCYCRQTGLLAALMLGSSALYFVMAHAITLDMPVSVLIALSAACFLGFAKQPSKRPVFIYLSAIAAALAVLTKGLIGLAIPGMIALSWLLLTRGWRILLTWHVLAAGILALFIILPWHVLAQQRHPDFFQFYIVQQHIMRYLTDSARRTAPWWFYGPILLFGFFPWTLLLPRLVHEWWRSARRETAYILGDSANAPRFRAYVLRLRTYVPRFIRGTQSATSLYLFLWLIIVTVFFSVSKSKLVPYVLPALPPLAILTAHGCLTLFATGAARCRAWSGTIILSSLVITGLGVALMLLPSLSQAWRVQLVANELQFLGGVYTAAALVCVCCWYRNTQMVYVLGTLLLTQLLLLGCFMSTWPRLEDRSIKPLAELYLQYADKQAMPVMYKDFFYDLPVYLKQKVISVAPMRGELRWGSTKALSGGAGAEMLLTEAKFLQLWRERAGLYVFSELEKDGHSPCDKLPGCEVLGKTRRHVMYRNMNNVPASTSAPPPAGSASSPGAAAPSPGASASSSGASASSSGASASSSGASALSSGAAAPSSRGLTTGSTRTQ